MAHLLSGKAEMEMETGQVGGGVGYLSATLSLICKHLNTLKNLMTELLAVLTVLILHSHLRKGVSAEKKRE